jgi:hypothetical protein
MRFGAIRMSHLTRLEIVREKKANSLMMAERYRTRFSQA